MSTENLTDARGFRAPYINRANAALRAQHVIGGDLTADETAGGTFLWLDGGRHGRRFELFRGHAGRYDVCAVSDGTLYVAAVATGITPAKYVTRYETGLDPRGCGWAYAETVPGDGSVTVMLVRCADKWLLVFKRDTDELANLMPDDVTGTPAEVCTIGIFRSTRYTDPDFPGGIEQRVRTDLWYGGEGGQTERAEPFAVRIVHNDQNNTDTVQIYEPAGQYSVFLSKDAQEFRDSTWVGKPSASTGGWYPLGTVTASSAVFLTDAGSVPWEWRRFRLSITRDSISDRPRQAIRIASLTRTGDGTDDSPFVFTVNQQYTGAYSMEFSTDQSAQRIMVEKSDGTMSDDIDGITWTRTTPAYLVKPYGSVVWFPYNTTMWSGRSNAWTTPKADPIAEDTGYPVYAEKIKVQTHESEHYEGFIPDESAGV